MAAWRSGCIREAFNYYYAPAGDLGVASKAYLDQMLAEPFEPFAFSPAGAAVYHLGPLGTAAKKLEIKP